MQSGPENAKMVSAMRLLLVSVSVCAPPRRTFDTMIDDFSLLARVPVVPTYQNTIFVMYICCERPLTNLNQFRLYGGRGEN